MLSDLAGKVALVTGSTQGIGKAIALKLADSGATVVIHGSRKSTDVTQQILDGGGKAQYMQADLSFSENASQLIDRVFEMYGALDILVNNAGITKDTLILRMSDADWDSVLNINLKACFIMTRAALKHMVRKRWGRIINISSIVGEIGNAGQANYAASKAGLIALTRSTALEVASRGITANAIAAGFIETNMTRKISEAMRQEILKRIPAGSFGTPEDIANIVRFIASEESHYITGQVFRVDGGLLTA